MDNVLIVAAHPDDEVLGVGATAARHVAQGDKVQCLILGEGQTSRSFDGESAKRSALEDLHAASMEAAKIIGFENVEFADLPDNRFDSIALLDIVKTIEKKINGFRPEIIYTHYIGDLNIDHQRTCQAVLTAARPFIDCCVRDIYAFETVSSTEWNFAGCGSFRPNVYINVEKYFEKKLEAIRCYQSELRDYPHPRSVKVLECKAMSWGSVVGRKYAEAFMLLRSVK